MRYATWNIVFAEGSVEGSVPPMVDGAFYKSNLEVVGYVPADTDIAALSEWSTQEITQAEFLDLALTNNPNVSLLPDGTLTCPLERP
jgi:hypothetical protein